MWKIDRVIAVCVIQLVPKVNIFKRKKSQTVKVLNKGLLNALIKLEIIIRLLRFSCTFLQTFFFF